MYSKSRRKRLGFRVHDVAPVEVAAAEAEYEHFRRRHIAGKGDVVLVAQAGNIAHALAGLFIARVHGGAEQIGARIAYNEIDMVLFFNDPRDEKSCESVSYISRLCDQNNIPFASNVATAEMLVLGLSRGDLDWRDIVNPKTKPFTA